MRNFTGLPNHNDPKENKIVYKAYKWQNLKKAYFSTFQL